MFKSTIPPRNRLCTHCSQPFLPGSSYCSLLEEEVRRDYCKECMDKVKRENSVFWEGRIPVKEEQGDLAALTLFKRLYSEDKKGLIYVLALYLERKKQLLRRVVKKELFFEDPIDGTVYRVEPTVLTEELKEKVVKLLQ